LKKKKISFQVARLKLGGTEVAAHLPLYPLERWRDAADTREHLIFFIS